MSRRPRRNPRARTGTPLFLLLSPPLLAPPPSRRASPAPAQPDVPRAPAPTFAPPAPGTAQSARAQVRARQSADDAARHARPSVRRSRREPRPRTPRYRSPVHARRRSPSSLLPLPRRPPTRSMHAARGTDDPSAPDHPPMRMTRRSRRAQGSRANAHAVPSAAAAREPGAWRSRASERARGPRLHRRRRMPRHWSRRIRHCRRRRPRCRCRRRPFSSG